MSTAETPNQPPSGQFSPDGNWRWDGNAWQPVNPQAAHQQKQPQAKKKRRVFWWFFLALQLLFIIWVISGIASGSGNTTDAEDAGTTIGVLLILVIWFFVDCFVAVIYGVYRLATRR